MYGSFCELYICLFLANVTEKDARSWLESMGVSLLEELLLKSSLTAVALGSVASLVLCCRPHVTEKVQAKWIKDNPEDEMADEDKEDEEDKEEECGQQRRKIKEDEDERMLCIVPGVVS